MSGSVLLILALQILAGVLTLAFGLACAGAARAPARAARADGWRLSAITFTLVGVVLTAHSLAAAWAVAAGTESAVYRLFVRWAPAANEARSFMVLGFAALLLLTVARNRPAPPRRTVYAVLAALLLAGAAVGASAGGWVARVHWPVLAVLSVVTVMVLFAALYVALVRDAVDYLLWFTLLAYTVREAIIANFHSVLAWFGVDGVWTPSMRSLLATGAAVLLVMLALTFRRLALARQGREVPALLERIHA